MINVNISENIKPNSYEFFAPHWKCWKMVGFAVDIDKRKRKWYLMYSLLINISVTICYPLHLALQLFRSDTQADNIKNLAITACCGACGIKFLIYSTKMPVIKQFEQLLDKLDERINDGSELNYFKQLKRSLRVITVLFVIVYFLIGLSALLSTIFREDRSLLYPAWFPFNWLESTWKYYAASVYQVVGVTILLLENYVNDCFPPMALCILSGHIKMLSMRVANIGYDEKLLEDNEMELNKCVTDQINLYHLYKTIENIISLPMFIQFCVTATCLCFSMAALLFYVSEPMDIFYYSVFFIAMPLQMFPVCYFGSEFQFRFDNLHRAVYESNWTNQSARYKKHMMLFTERSLKQNVAMAGGMLRIHLDTFISTCRGAYSLFAIIMRMK